MALALDDIKYFITVTETLNVTRASEIIGISQPALSYSIKRLENEVGVELFIRLKNGLKLSKSGEEFLLRARKLIFQWQDTQNLMNPESGLSSRSYTFAIHPSVALFSLNKFLPKLLRLYPNLNYNFIHGLSREMTQKVINWEADFAIVVNPIKHPDLIIIKLCTDEVSIYYKSGACQKLIYDQNMAQAKSILKKLNSGNSKIFKSSGEICSENLEVVASLVNLKAGYGVLPSRVARKFSTFKKLKNAPIFKDEICLVYRVEKNKDKIEKEIIKAIKEAKI